MNNNRHTERAKAIITWFETYQMEEGSQVILEKRQQLSIACAAIASQYAKAQYEFKTTYFQRKVSEAKSKLTHNGTVAEREAKAIQDNEDLRIKEAQLDGKVSGYKIVLDSYFKVLDSMASIINTLNR